MAFDPTDPLGTDFDGIDDIDRNGTAASGRTMLGKSVIRRWITEPGELFWAPGVGAGLLRYMSGMVDNLGALPGILKNQALEDDRVQACAVNVQFVGEDLQVIASITDAKGPFPLVFSLKQTGQISIDVLGP